MQRAETASASAPEHVWITNLCTVFEFLWIVGLCDTAYSTLDSSWYSILLWRFPFWRSTIDYHSFAKSTFCTCVDVQSFLRKKYCILFCTCYPLSITLLEKLLSPFPFITLNNSYIQKDVPWQKHEDPTWHLSRHVWTSSSEAVICTTWGYWTNSNLGNFPI